MLAVKVPRNMLGFVRARFLCLLGLKPETFFCFIPVFLRGIQFFFILLASNRISLSKKEGVLESGYGWMCQKFVALKRIIYTNIIYKYNKINSIPDEME